MTARPKLTALEALVETAAHVRAELSITELLDEYEAHLLEAPAARVMYVAAVKAWRDDVEQRLTQLEVSVAAVLSRRT